VCWYAPTDLDALAADILDVGGTPDRSAGSHEGINVASAGLATSASTSPKRSPGSGRRGRNARPVRATRRPRPRGCGPHQGELSEDFGSDGTTVLRTGLETLFGIPPTTISSPGTQGVCGPSASDRFG